MTANENIFESIRDERDTLSRAFRLIADFLSREPGQFINSPMRVLSEKIGVSDPTLIRFARHYGFQGLPDLRLALARSTAMRHGSDSGAFEPLLRDKEIVNRPAKQVIAAKAAELVQDDNSILLDSGSTMQFLAAHLAKTSGKTILTTSLSIIMMLHQSGQHRLIMPGGALRPGALSIGGRMAETNLSGMSFDTVYLGADAVHAQFGLSTYDEEEAHLNRAMIRAGKRVVALVDSSKFHDRALHKICDFSQVDIIITDDLITPEARRAIEATDTRLILAETGLSFAAGSDQG